MKTAKKINAIIFLIMMVLSLPTAAILVSANAVPGDPFYPLKSVIEKVASTIASPSYQARSDLEVKLVQRRIEENQRLLLSSGSTKGLQILIAQAESAKEYILSSNTSQQVKSQAIQKLVATLEDSHRILEERKRNIAATNTIHNQITNQVKSPISQGNSPIVTPTPTNTPSQTPPPTIGEPEPDPEEIIEDIIVTEEEIEEIIEELEDEAEAIPENESNITVPNMTIPISNSETRIHPEKTL